MSRITDFKIEKVVCPLRTTFATSLGSKTEAKSIIIKLTDETGRSSLGEVPTSFVLPNETLDAIQQTLSQARDVVIGRDSSEYSVITAQFRNRWPEFHMTASGLEVALFRLWLAGRSQREFDFWGSKSSKIETDITVPFVPDKEILTKWLSAVLKTGFRIYKIKVSGNVEQDFTFVRDVQQLLQASLPGYTIRLDGNQGFDVSSTLLLINKLQKARIEIELFEQPLHKNDYSGFKELCPRSPVPVIVDETVFCTADCNRVINDKLAHGINIKIAKSGISTSAEIMKLSKQAGLKLMIGCMTETFVGLSAAIFLAAGTADFDYIDLDSIHFMDSFPAYDCGIDIQNRFFEILPGPQC